MSAQSGNRAKDLNQYRSGYLWGSTLMGTLAWLVINADFSKWVIPGTLAVIWAIVGLLALGRWEAKRGQ